MRQLLPRRCPSAGVRWKKGAVFGSILLTCFLSLWIHLNMVLYRNRNSPSSVLLASNTSTYDITSAETAADEEALESSLQSTPTHLHGLSIDGTGGAPVTKIDVAQKTIAVSALARRSWRPQSGVSLNSSDPEVMEVFAKTQAIQAVTRPTSLIEIGLPGVHTYLPHLKNNPEYLNPAVMVSQNRTRVKLVIGIPTVKRPNDGYLVNTLNSIVSSLSYADSLDCLIIVFIAEPWNISFVANLTTFLQEQYPTEIASGLMDILAPRSEFYPNLDALPLTLGDNEERVKWRTKQNLDYAFLMLHAYRRGQHYIQLEDDIITKPGFFTNIITALNQREDSWLVLKFSTLGFIGKLFHAKDLPFIAEFLLMFYRDKPGDWLLDNLMTTKMCGNTMVWKECLNQVNKIAIEVKPSLFQHIGYHSSLKGKVQLLKDRTFQLLSNIQRGRPTEAMRANSNPKPTRIETTIREYKAFKIQYAYLGAENFWGITPKRNDVIEFIYDPAINIARYKLVSGSKINRNDLFPVDTTVEVSAESVQTTQQSRNVTRSNQFQVVGYFNELGVAEATLPANIGSIGVFRIRVNSNMTSWVILSNITITLR